MRIIISPAKKMSVDTDSLPVRDLPAFLEQTEELYRELQSKSPEELQKLWKCNDQIAALNVERLRQMELRRNLTPSVLAYEGIQYQYMAPNVFTSKEYDYIQEHLRILSGFYGIRDLLADGTLGRVLVDKEIPIGEYLQENGYDMQNHYPRVGCISSLEEVKRAVYQANE